MQNMRHKKLAAMLLTLVMALSLLTVTAFAEDGNEAKIGEQEYPTFELAVENAKGGDTITLLQNVAVDATVELKKSVTLDLGTFTLSHSGDQVLEVYANVTIQNGTVSMTDRASGSAIWLNEDAKLTLEKNATVSATKSPNGNTSFAIGLRPNCAGAELVVKGKVTGENGITPNGTLKTENTISIEDGAVIDVKGTALYLAGNANTTVGKAEITGDTGIEIRAGSLEVNGATIKANGTFLAEANSGGTTVTGVAVAVSQHTTNQKIDVAINSGSLSGEKAFYEVDLEDDIGADDVTMNVQGGTFSGEVASQNKTNFVAGGTFDSQVDSTLIDTTKTAASLNSGDSATYYIGDAEAVAKTLADNANAGDVITVQQGSMALTNVAAGVKVENDGQGTVTANGQEVAAGGGEVTIPAPEPEPEPEPEPDPEPEKPAYDKNEGKEFAKVEVGETDSSSHADDENKDNPSTGDSSNLAIAVAAMLISAGGAAAAFLSKQKKA